jgi:hypothetical protein
VFVFIGSPVARHLKPVRHLALQHAPAKTVDIRVSHLSENLR